MPDMIAAQLIPDPTTDKPVFYTLPAESLDEGMTTDDGQTVLDATQTDTGASAHVYTPADDEDEDTERQGSPELRGYEHNERVDMADFVDTENPGRGHPDALVRLSLAPAELRAGDLYVGLDSKPIQRVEESGGVDVTRGRQYFVDLGGGETVLAYQSETTTVLRASGVIDEILVTELEEGDQYRDHDGQTFFQVESVETGDVAGEDEDGEQLSVDDIVVESTCDDASNRAIYDSCTFVQRWRHYPTS